MIFFTADDHFYHQNVIKYCNRPFSSVEEMNEELIKRWNERVKPEDTVYHLGDFALAHRAVTVFAPRLNGHKHLIMGNHDHCHKLHYKKDTKKERMEQIYFDAGFETLQYEMVLSFEKHKFLLHHMPYAGDSGDQERFSNWRPKNYGQILLHGHVHQTWHIKDKMINVGVDVNDYYPVSIDEIITIANVIKNG
jgi:calcineurin-like phosphoesterase family protein